MAVLKSDTKVGKNYLAEKEIKLLERAVSAFFDYIEGIIERRNTFSMESFAESVKDSRRLWIGVTQAG